MKKKKFLAILTAGVMALSMAACGDTSGTDTPTNGTPETETSTEQTPPSDDTQKEPEKQDQTTPAAQEEEGPVSVDFEDGLFAFAIADKSINSASDNALVELADYNGSKALKVTSTQGKMMYVAIQADAMLGASASSLATVEMTIGIENPDGVFAATAGKIYGMVGEGNQKTSNDWSVYLENVNPKKVSYTVPGEYTFGEGNYIVVSLETDNGKSEGATPAVMYIDNIVFKDASGNVLTADTSVEAVIADTGEDRSNLFAITDVIDLNFSVSGGEWSQAGIDLTEEQLAAITEDSVFEITYSSGTGDMWLVFPGSAAGWMRVGVGDCDGSGQGYSYVNGSKNIAQVDYATIAQWLGTDVSAWGTTLQCESNSAWDVYSIKLGKKTKNISISGGVELDGFSVSGGGWSQAGMDMTEDFIAQLVPGSAIEITYTSETGEIWLVFPGSAAGWMRIGVGDYDGSGQGYGIFDGSKCYITYETIAEWLGDDVSAWGTTIQCEATSNWEAYALKVGKASEMVANNRQVEIPGFSVSGGGWSQAGVDLDEASLAALQPGCVINITYTSETGEIWLVFPGSAAGWMRIGVGDYDGSGQGYAVCDGTHAQITYDTIAEWLGDDVSAWGTTLQCEATSNWEVYAVNIGQQ